LSVCLSVNEIAQKIVTVSYISKPLFHFVAIAVFKSVSK